MLKVKSGNVNNGITICSVQIVTECNKGVRKMKQIEELVCIEMLLDFGKVKVTTCFSLTKISYQVFNRCDSVM